MQKIILILFVILIFSGCSVTKRTGGNDDRRLLNADETERRVEELERQNITKRSFFIQKAEIEVSYQNINKKLIGSIKFEQPDKYLVSIKSWTGIEAARIFISNDTILVNDRINKKLITAPHDYLLTKYGLTENLLAIVFGDYISDKGLDFNSSKCLNGKLDLNSDFGDVQIRYIIDCKLNKIIFASNEKILRAGQVEIKFDDFRKAENILIPGKIIIKDIETMATIIISIKNIEYPWSGKIEFIPGSNYEIRQLL